MPTQQELLATVVGLDNVSPVFNPDSRWQCWNMQEIYLGTTGAGKFVPKPGDVVFEITGATIVRYIVQEINPITMIPVFRQEDNSSVTQPLSEDDVLLANGPGTQSYTYRVYLDRSVTPYRLAVDARLKVGGSAVRWAKIFKGANISDSGVVVSGVYNQNGALVSENVPLELVASTGLTNHAIKVVAPCHTTHDLVNGELVTIVFYNAVGFAVSRQQLLVENTAFIRSTDASQRYVVGISLESPFLSSAAARTIEYPLNVPLNAMNLVGWVHYSNGSVAKYAVDGSKFSVSGLDSYAATIVGQKSDLVLKYTLSSDEVAYGAYIGADTHISEIYHIVTANMNGSYAVQLYAYPVWIDAVNGYRLEWFLYDLQRSVRFNVTSQVRINTALGLYDGKNYGAKQTLSVSLNLKDVNGSYNSFVHVQLLDIVLNKPGSSRPDLDNVPNWNTSVVAGQAALYGRDAYATYLRVSSNNWRLNLSADLPNQDAWLDKVYWSTMPLFDPYRETKAPRPTHFRLVAGAHTVDYALSSWDTDLVLSQSLPNNSSVFLHFFHRTTERDLELSVSGLPLYHIDANGNFV